MIAAVLVTHNSERWLRTTLDSITSQTRQPDRIIVIDDHSTDSTASILAEFGITPITATSTATDITTRIAHNFQQGIREAKDADIVVLGDHDDVWHADRIAHQVALLEGDVQALMLASDGTLVDAEGIPTGGTLRSTFPVSAHWNDKPADQQLSEALKHSVATGGASAIRPTYFAVQEIPAGWLHDRWWSLLATVRLGMRIDETSVIDYRVQGDQQVGLDTGTQSMSAGDKAKARAKSLGASRNRAKDLHSVLGAQCATPSLRAELRWSRLLKSGLS